VRRIEGNEGPGLTTAPTSRSRLRIRVVLGILLVSAVALLLEVAQPLRAPLGGPNDAAEANIMNALAVAQGAIAPGNASFSGFTPSELGSRMSVKVLPGAGSGSPHANPGQAISVQVCADGQACRELVLATRGAIGTCWFGRYVLGPANGSSAVDGTAVARGTPNRQGACWARDAPTDGWTHIN
jgi:hypothetical protein